MTTALLIKTCGDIDEITLNEQNFQSNLETTGYDGEFRLLYTWLLDSKIVEMYGFIAGASENFEELPEHEQQFPSYFGDIMFVAKNFCNNYISFGYIDFALLQELEEVV